MGLRAVEARLSCPLLTGGGSNSLRVRCRRASCSSCCRCAAWGLVIDANISFPFLVGCWLWHVTQVALHAVYQSASRHASSAGPVPLTFNPRRTVRSPCLLPHMPSCGTPAACPWSSCWRRGAGPRGIRTPHVRCSSEWLCFECLSAQRHAACLSSTPHAHARSACTQSPPPPCAATVGRGPVTSLSCAGNLKDLRLGTPRTCLCLL